MKPIQIVSVVSAAVLLCSCGTAQRSTLTAGNLIARYEQRDTALHAVPALVVYEVTRSHRVTLENKGEYILISGVDTAALGEPNVYREVQSGPRRGWRADTGNRYFAPTPTEAPSETADAQGSPIAVPRGLRYQNSRPVLQGMSILMKVRPSVEPSDSFPMIAEGAFNPALAGGWRFNWHTFSPVKDAFDRNTTTFSVTGGVFVGVGTVTLSPSNTRSYPLSVNRAAPLVASGAFSVFGYNNVNLGVSVGMDNAVGRAANTWVYQRRPWVGLTAGFDIIK
jgi:hypothetical protein